MLLWELECTFHSLTFSLLYFLSRETNTGASPLHQNVNRVTIGTCPEYVVSVTVIPSWPVPWMARNIWRTKLSAVEYQLSKFFLKRSTSGEVIGKSWGSYQHTRTSVFFSIFSEVAVVLPDHSFPLCSCLSTPPGYTRNASCWEGWLRRSSLDVHTLGHGDVFVILVSVIELPACLVCWLILLIVLVDCLGQPLSR